MKKWLLARTCLTAAGVALFHGATAQTVQVADANSSNSGISEIVVTAEKRSTSLQKTPAAITAITGDALIELGITDLTDAQALVPAARFQNEGVNVQLFLRGVGASLDYGNVQPAVGFNFNGIPIPREGTSVGFFDIAQLEVLPGPQGTLYGSSAMGGTVNVNFNRPAHDNESHLILEGGNYDLFHATAVQNLNVSNDFALRGAVDYIRHDGYQTSGSDSQNDLSGRLSALYDPTEDFKAYIWGYGATKDGREASVEDRAFNGTTLQPQSGAFLHPNNPWDDTYPPNVVALNPFFSLFGPVKSYPQTYTNFALGGEFNWAIGNNMQLTYIPSYLFLNSINNYNIAFIPATLTQKYNQITQELRLSGDVGQLHWLTGFYGYTMRNDGYNYYLFAYHSDVERDLLQGAAVFADTTYKITNDLRVNLGARVGIDDRKANGLQGDGVTPYSFNKDFNHVDYKIGADYDVTPTILAYVNYQTGYQPGTFNERANSATFNNEVKSTELSAASVGVKSRFWDQKLQVNDEFFYYDYRNLLLQSYNVAAAFEPIFNAKSVTIYGDQLDVTVKPTTDDQVIATGAFTHGVYNNFTTPDGLSYNNNSLAFTPTWTFDAGYAHDFHINFGSIKARFDARYASSYWGDFAHTPGDKWTSFWTFDSSVTYRPNDQVWSIGLWGKNLTNVPVQTATGIGAAPGPVASYLAPPRTFGGRITADF